MTRTTERWSGDGVRWLLVVALAALMATHPLAVHGCSCGHDFDFHLVSWMEAANQFRHGNLYPHWAFSPAFNAGEPRFVFYPPLSWMLGGWLGLLLGDIPGIAPNAAWSVAPMLFTWIALALAGVSLYRLAREFVSANAAGVAAALYIANPYMLFTAFERTAYGELLAAAWIPLLFLGVLRRRITIAGIAVPLALLWLTNAPAAVMGTYALALLAGTRVAAELYHSARKTALKTAVQSATGAALGMGVSGYYLIPAIYERRYVQIAMATIGGMQLNQNFLFEHTGTSPDAILHDKVLHTASVIAVILLGATCVTLATVFLQRRPSGTNAALGAGDKQPGVVSRTRPAELPLLSLAILAMGIAIMLTPFSSAVWSHTPEATFLQFPWRLLALLSPVLALTLAAVLDRYRLSTKWSAVVAILVAAALSIPAYRAFRQHCYPEDTPPAQYASMQSQAGTDPTDEYTPTNADNDSLKSNDPPYWLSQSANDAAPPAASPGSAPTQLSIAANHPEFLILNLRDYPAWRIDRNGNADPEREPRADGLIALPVPTGISTFAIHYGHSADETMGAVLTALSALVLGLLWMQSKRQPTRERPTVA